MFLIVLPAKATDILARLRPEQAACYAEVKDVLLRKYRLSAEDFHLKFGEPVKKPQKKLL